MAKLNAGFAWAATVSKRIIFLAFLASFSSPPEVVAQTLPPVGGTYVMPVYSSGKNGQRSYLRLHNPSAKSGTAVVYLFESGTATMLGKWTKTIPSQASLQTEINIIEREAVPAVSSTKSYTAYVNATFNGFVQHIVWNDVGGALTNLTNCGRDTADNAVPLLEPAYSAYRTSFEFKDGTGGTLNKLRLVKSGVGGFDLDYLGGPVAWVSPASAFAQKIADQINAFVSTPDFTATASGNVFTITGGPGTEFGGTSPGTTFEATGSIGTFVRNPFTFVTTKNTQIVCSSAAACLGNIHSTLISQYPSFLQIYNPGGARSLNLTMIDSLTGNTIGTPSVDLGANTTNTVGIASLEKAIGYQPSISHYNVRTENGFAGYASHFVNNLTAGVLTNMTDKCVINAVATP